VAVRRTERTPAQRGVAIGAALVLVVTAVVVLAIGTPRSDPLPWVSGWVTDRASTMLMVRAAGQDAIAGTCGPPQARFTVEETPTEIRVAATGVRFVRPVACLDVGWGPTSHAVALRAPVGDRRLVDVTAGATRPLLDASTAATITSLPSRLRTTDLAVETVDGTTAVRRSWTGSDRGVEEFATLETTDDLALERLSGGRVERVDGVPVRFHAGARPGPRNVYSLQWRPRTGGTAFVDLHLRAGSWTSQDALDVPRRLVPARG